MCTCEEKKEEKKLDRELQKRMESCGHFLYHRKGGRFGQEKILRILYDNDFTSAETAVDQQLLQAMLGVRSGSISEIIGKLQTKGYIEKVQKSGDRRKNCIYLTPKGILALREEIEGKNKKEAVLFDVLSEQEKEELLKLLKRLLKSWDVSEEIQNRHG